MIEEERLIGFGAMRLSTDADRHEARALSVIEAALDAGASLVDTAPTYGLGEGDLHHNERLVAEAIARRPPGARSVAVVTKCGMTREGPLYVTDGRAKKIASDAESSLRALGASCLDVLLLHSVDRRTPIETSARALEELRKAGIARRIGLSNVNGAELDRARAVAQIEAIELELGAFSDAGFKSGLAADAAKNGLLVLLHSPLGGPKRAPKLARDPALRAIAERLGESAAAIALAYFGQLHARVVCLPGARRIETATSAVRAATLLLGDGDRARLDERFSAAAQSFGRSRREVVPRTDGEIVMVMGIQGAGKSTLVADYVARGFVRLNRDARGGTLAGLASELDARLEAGERRLVVDNTYATRAQRADIVQVAERRGASVRCLHLDTPLEAAQCNVVRRLVERHGHLPSPEELGRARKIDPQAFLPNTLSRFRRELEPPSVREGFSEVTTLPFVPKRDARLTRRGWVVAIEALDTEGLGAASLAALANERPDATLVFGWLGDRSRAAVELAFATARDASLFSSPVELLLCDHLGGPPSCWCRPPLPGLVIPWMLRERIDPERSRLVGRSAAHRTLARALGIGFVELPAIVRPGRDPSDGRG